MNKGLKAIVHSSVYLLIGNLIMLSDLGRIICDVWNWVGLLSWGTATASASILFILGVLVLVWLVRILEETVEFHQKVISKYKARVGDSCGV
jgi:hypothetical protein